jgi:type I restriction enzyme S subunit
MNAVTLDKIIKVNYGRSLRAEERTQSGNWSVFGSNGEVGKHDEALVSGPTLVIGRKGSVGSVTLAPSGGWIIDTAFYTELLEPDSTDLRYLYYALRESRLEKHKITTSIPGISRDDIYKTAIPLPPPEEQKRIAAILDKADALRRKRAEALRLTDDFLQSVFLDMFGDPVTNPKAWPTANFGDENVGILDRGRSRHRPRNAPELLGGPHPLIQTGDVANCNRYIRRHTQTYSEVGLQQSRMWPTGTLCITIAANIAKTGILTFDACFPDSVVGFKPGPAVTTEYVQFWLSFLQAMLEKTAPESAQKNINLDILRKLSIPLPPPDAQTKFTSIVQKTDASMARMFEAESQIDDLFKACAQRAFRGEL